MKFIFDFLYRLKPGIPRENLFLIAGFTWLFAGFMLLYKGILFVFGQGHYKAAEVIIASIIGILFYIAVFVKISDKHITRIKSITDERPFPLSFFDIKGYILISVMITAGIALRHINTEYWDYLYTFYIGMGIPLIISSMTFFNTWYKEISIKE